MAAVPRQQLVAEPSQPNELTPPEAEITDLFREVLEMSNVQADDDFFDLGGDSLNAATLMASIESRFGVSLPVSAILQATTPRALANQVSEARIQAFSSCVIRVQEAGAGSPVFVVHGLGGDVAYARKVAAILGPSRPVYGLRAVGLSAGEIPISGIPNIAARYVSELRGVRPKGPYFVHGYCGGAFIAYEIAQQLLRQGEEVSGLVMVDPPLDWRRSPFLIASGPLLRFLQSLATLRLYWARLRSAFRLKRPDNKHRSRMLVRSLYCALSHYEPLPYERESLMIHSRESRGIMFNARRGLQHLMSKAHFIEGATTHGELFADDAPTLGQTKAFIEGIDPTVRKARSK